MRAQSSLALPMVGLSSRALAEHACYVLTIPGRRPLYTCIEQNYDNLKKEGSKALSRDEGHRFATRAGGARS